MQISKKQVQEWAENPTNELLISLITDHIEYLNALKGAESYVPYDPQRTQENLAALNGELGAWADIVLVLQGDWESLDHEEDEHLGDIPEG